MASIPIKYSENYDDLKKERYIQFVHGLGENVSFEQDTWVCTNLRRYPYEDNHKLSVYFSSIPPQYRELIKYFAVIRLLNGITVNGLKYNITSMAVFLNYITNEGITNLSYVTIHTAALFKQYLDKHYSVEVTKNGIWLAAGLLFRIMQDFNGMKLKNYFSLSPYDSHKNHDYKFIPDYVADQLDAAFMDDAIRLEYRTVYWILRLIPSRISEVLSIKTDCLKQYKNDYVLFIPMWKQNGGGKEPIMRSIHINNEGMGVHLISLITEQIHVAKQFQKFMPANRKNALFTYQRKITEKGITYQTQDYRTLTFVGLKYQLSKICEQYNIRDENGNIYYVTTHQFRHNGITDRLAAGFTVEQIADMTGHHGDAMIWGAYTHLNLKPEQLVEKQRYTHKEDFENPYVLFGGRILNMEVQLEKRLLGNLRAHKVRGGICSDITGCKSDMWNCLNCVFFVPDAEQSDYYEEQARLWHEKCIKFSSFPIIKGTAERNAGFYENVLKKLRDGEYTL